MTETSARVIARSAHPFGGPDLITVEVTLHRFVLAELNTHRVFSRNSASSRAIPVERMLERYAKDPAFPVSLPAEQPGMQGGTELEGDDLADARLLLDDVHQQTAIFVKRYLAAHPDKATRLHKSVINRLLEPFLWHTVIITATEWDNFFGLRCHPLAQPEIRLAAERIREAIEGSQPVELTSAEQWHAPFADDAETDVKARLRQSVARCAWVSTAAHDGDHTEGAINRMVERLGTAVPLHASPFEHQARPYAGNRRPGNFQRWEQLRHVVEKRGIKELLS